MVTIKDSCSCVRSLLLTLLALEIVLGIGLWGAAQFADDNRTHIKQAGFACVLGALALLAIAGVGLLSALATLRRQHRKLLEAFLPRRLLLQSQQNDGAVDDDDHDEDGLVLGRAPADTPANLLLDMMGDLLEGKAPHLRDVVFIRTALLSNTDVYQPFNVRAAIKGANLEADVAQSLMNQLGGGDAARGPSPRATQDANGGGGGGGGRRDIGPSRSFQFLPKFLAATVAITTTATTAAADIHDGVTASIPDYPSVSIARSVHGNGNIHGHGNSCPRLSCDSLTSALALILTPQPAAWQDATVLPDDSPSELITGIDARDLKSPSAGAAAAAAAALMIERRTPNTASPVHHGPHHHPGASLLEKAASLLDRGRRRRRPSIEAPSQVSQVVDIARDTGSRSSLQAFGFGASLGRRGSTADRDANGSLGNGIRLDFRYPSQVPSAAGLEEKVRSIGAATNSSGGRMGGPDDDDDVDSPTCTTLDGESCGGGGGGGGGGSGMGLLVPAANSEAIAPRRLSAVWGIMSKRGVGTLNSSRKASLDGNPNAAVSAVRTLSPAFGPNSFSVQHRPSSTQTPWAHVASDLLFQGQSRLGGGGGGGGGAIPRTVSVRAAAGIELPLSSATGPSTVAAAATAAAAEAAIAEAIKRSTPPPPAMIDEVERLLSHADGWQFDTWALQEASGGHALSALGFYLIQREGLIKAFQIPSVTLARFLRQVEAGYLDNPYHNAVHAADVLQTLHVIIHATQLHVHYLDHLGLLAAYCTAIVHDYAHPGLTNDFLIATSDPLAVRYNDRSPLENHHCAASFGLLQRPELDFLAPLAKSERSAFRKQVIEMVLATDMKQHFSILSHFNTVHRLSAYSQQQATGTANRQPRRVIRRTLTRALSNTNENTPEPASSPFAAYWSEPPPNPLDETERLLSLQVALKAADIGHLGEALGVHKRWLSALEEEFFRQGDQERQLGLSISPLFDRSKQGVSKSQVGFYDLVALPLVHALASAFPGAQQLMKCFVLNYNHWRQVEGQPPMEVPSTERTVGGSGLRSGQTLFAAVAATPTAVAAAAAAAGPTAAAAAAAVAAAATVSTVPAAVMAGDSEQGGLENLLLTVPDDALEVTVTIDDAKV